MRDRSGRSGRRSGSQKPGQVCGAASSLAAGCCAPARSLKPTASAATTIAPAKAARVGQRQKGKAVTKGITGKLSGISGLIDHPGGEARADFLKYPVSEVALEVFGRLFRRPLQVEGGDEMPVAIHQVDQRGVVHGVVAIL